MRIQSEKLRARSEAAGVDDARLASAVERPGLKGSRAVSAVRNWKSGRDHPRCKAGDIAKLADALACQAKDLARFESRVMFNRGSPRKAKLLVDLVRGKRVDEALNLLTFTPKRAAVNIKKALAAAIADAERAEADVTALVVVESRCDNAPHIKRFNQKDRGRAHPILKRSNHITIGLEERA